ncbi:FliH/SctL family protein [Desulfuromonas thiophila]|nr:FliH/SctL family protein [Desulfuromonas thiophila]
MSSSRILRGGEMPPTRPVRLCDLAELKPGQPGSFVPAADCAASAPAEPATPVASAATTEPAKAQAKASKSASASPPPAAPEPAQSAQEREQLRQQAYDEGFAAAEKKLHQQFDSTTKALGDACRQISRAREQILQRSRDDMLELVIAIAQRVIQLEVEERRDLIRFTVEKAIAAAVQAEEFHIRVHPEDMAVVEEHKPLFIASLSGLSNIEFVADRSLSRGGCVLESPAGKVDARIETQLDEIFSHLRSKAGEPS